MDKELVKKWVAALRSGEYKQGRGELVSSTGEFCCLGVATAVACGSTDRKKIRDAAGGVGVINSGWLREALGIDGSREVTGTGFTRVISSSLIVMNDTQRKTFPEIADYIEKELLSDEQAGA